MVDLLDEVVEYSRRLVADHGYEVTHFECLQIAVEVQRNRLMQPPIQLPLGSDLIKIEAELRRIKEQEQK